MITLAAAQSHLWTMAITLMMSVPTTKGTFVVDNKGQLICLGNDFWHTFLKWALLDAQHHLLPHEPTLMFKTVYIFYIFPIVDGTDALDCSAKMGAVMYPGTLQINPFTIAMCTE
jgi:hypothetical protein